MLETISPILLHASTTVIAERLNLGQVARMQTRGFPPWSETYLSVLEAAGL